MGHEYPKIIPYPDFFIPRTIITVILWTVITVIFVFFVVSLGIFKISATTTTSSSLFPSINGDSFKLESCLNLRWVSFHGQPQVQNHNGFCWKINVGMSLILLWELIIGVSGLNKILWWKLLIHGLITSRWKETTWLISETIWISTGTSVCCRKLLIYSFIPISTITTTIDNKKRQCLW